ncbi:putative membrane protein [Clostridium bornimense]|uniref:Putative membrane protein n=1 Tax=Clostridium bornimense TaxID=1216932 RepID=W6RWS1_9CLOT|nr:hypothetical protein [Clostridium bornimense]CDM68084.1 putative membrane protein [Clostridium bornimense]
MKFLPFMSGQEFLQAYPVYCAIIILLFYLFVTGKRRKESNYVIEELSIEDVFMINNINRKNIRELLAFFTYGLLVKGYIENLDKDKGLFRSKQEMLNSNSNLNIIEMELMNNFSGFGVEFNSIVNDSRLINLSREYYCSKEKEFLKRGLIDVIEKTTSIKIEIIIAYSLTIIPGILRVFSGMINEKPVTYLIYEIIITIVILYIISKNIMSNKITEKGKKSIKAFKKINGNYKDSNNGADINIDDYNRLMASFVLFNIGIDYFGVPHAEDHDNFGGHSCSSCSSCSSCGGGCGGCGGD